MPRRPALLIKVLLLSLLVLVPAHAQGAIRLNLSPPQTDTFPRITTYLEVMDESGAFISGLRPPEFTILEDGRSISPGSLQELVPGAQLVVAINPGPPFAIRDSQGLTRYDYLVQGLESWISNSPDATQDDLSLLTTSSVEGTHLADPAAWLAALQSYQPDLRGAQPGLEVLSRALDVAADSPPRHGMGRAVLFITSPPSPGAAAVLEDLSARAGQAGVRIFVWLVASQSLFDTPEAQLLRDLAASTAGQFFGFSGTEELPDVEAYLTPLRRTYLLVYDSQISTSGPHELVVQWNHPDGELSSEPRAFELEIAPPNPIFVSLPAQITRVYPATGEQSAADLAPQRLDFEVLIEFPDGYERPLTRTVLYVNGEPVAENSRPPFDRFVWDLTQTDAEGRFVLRVEAFDSLGLRGASIETPLQITIDQPRQDALVVLSRNGPILAGVAILMAGAILVFVLVLAGRIRPQPRLPVRRLRRPANNSPTRPVSSRIPTRPTGVRRLTNWAAELPQALHRPADRARPWAYLTRLTGADGQPVKATPIPIKTDNLLLGSDPEKAGLVLEDASVEAQHAELRRSPEGTYQLKDLGSVAGTWINYAPLSQEWARVEDGDLVHFGRVGFRFKIARPTVVRQPKVTFEEPAP